VGVPGSIFFIVLFLVRVEQGTRGNWMAWLLCAQSGMAAFRILFRKESRKDSIAAVRLLAWLSALAPLSMLVAAPSILALPGIVLSLWSLITLGESFSIAPSDRGLVAKGPYHIVRHPMYAGELLALIGTCLSNPLLWNWSVLAVFALSIYVRIIQEESLIAGYGRYTRAVAWRLLPYVW